MRSLESLIRLEGEVLSIYKLAGLVKRRHLGCSHRPADSLFGVVGSSAGVLGAARVPNWVFVETAGGCLSSDGYRGHLPSHPGSIAARL